MSLKFGEKVKTLRNQAGMTQKQLAEALGVSLRTINNYEQCDAYPRNREVYSKLAEVLHVDINYLLTEDENFITKAGETYGSRGMKQAQKLISDMSGLFAGGDLTENDQDIVMKALQEVYWDAKARNRVKYNPNKNKKK